MAQKKKELEKKRKQILKQYYNYQGFPFMQACIFATNFFDLTFEKAIRPTKQTETNGLLANHLRFKDLHNLYIYICYMQNNQNQNSVRLDRTNFLTALKVYLQVKGFSVVFDHSGIISVYNNRYDYANIIGICFKHLSILNLAYNLRISNPTDISTVYHNRNQYDFINKELVKQGLLCYEDILPKNLYNIKTAVEKNGLLLPAFSLTESSLDEAEVNYKEEQERFNKGKSE